MPLAGSIARGSHLVRAPAFEQVAARLGMAGFAVWHGNQYAVEVFEHLGLPDGAVRVGIVHTNMEDEVDRLLEALPAV